MSPLQPRPRAAERHHEHDHAGEQGGRERGAPDNDPGRLRGILHLSLRSGDQGPMDVCGWSGECRPAIICHPERPRTVMCADRAAMVCRANTAVSIRRRRSDRLPETVSRAESASPCRARGPARSGRVSSCVSSRLVCPSCPPIAPRRLPSQHTLPCSESPARQVPAHRLSFVAWAMVVRICSRLAVIGLPDGRGLCRTTNGRSSRAD